MSKNDRGFTVVEALLVMLVIAVISFVGYYIWNQQSNSKSSTSYSSQNQTNKSAVKSSPGSTLSENKYFSILLPSGWKVDSDHTHVRNGNETSDFAYIDGKGRMAGVIINQGNTGGGQSDAFGNFTVQGKGFKFDKNLTFCTADPEKPWGCRAGYNGMHVLYGSTASTVNGNRYFFSITDDHAKSQAAADAITVVLETIQVK